MSEKIIGREKEKYILDCCCESNRSEFVAVYGRRRVGKTFLVRKFFENRFAFYATGILDGDRDEQLRNFNEEISARGHSNLAPATNWREAFANLSRLIEGKPKAEKKIVFLDEIPWMDTMHSGFLSALDHFWNRWASVRGDVLLIVCGSATSWMVGNLVNNKGGLHNRLTRQILLAPFTLNECESYYRSRNISMSRYEMVEAYMIFGGVPYYMSLMDGRYSLYQNVDMLYFEDGAELRNEYSNLYRSLFRDAENYSRVVQALASKNIGLSRQEIVKFSKLPNGGSLTRILEDLIACGFVRVYRAFGRDRRGSLYQLIDGFSRFHIRFSKKRDSYSNKFWLQFSSTPAHNAWSGIAFEQVCLLHVDQIKQKLGISGILTEVSSWRSNEKAGNGRHGAQIDLVIDRSDKVINLCEIKYASGEFAIDRKYDAVLRDRRSAFAAATQTRKAVHTTMITTFGVKRNEYKGAVQSEVTIDDLFS
ncbi:MAG: ATP-binding protein [Clostridiales Family XIII bacterium]|jgi:hypothetical protein|nr:ATP-binding protein [Clostridiales Family XIII bacterium]